MNEVLVAVFDSDGAATRAISALTGTGIPRTSIRRYRRDEYEASTGMAGSGTTLTGAPATERPHESKGGFWSWLLGEEGGTADYHPEYEHDYGSYRTAVEAGHAVVAVSVNQADVHRVHDLLEAQSPVQIEDSGPTREVGTQGSATASAPTASAAQPSAATSAASGRTASGATRSSNAGKEEVIPLAEEHVDVGKRRVESGSTRIRRYVTERPVEQRVNLRDEHVEIERRKPVGGASNVGSDAFQERTVEVRESREEPVVERRAEVGEEVVVRKEVREHPETVRTTERKEKVDVARGDKT